MRLCVGVALNQGAPVTRPNGATKRPVNDLTSFDVSKHSPEQIARLFACWKEQHRRVERRKEAAPIRARSLRIMPRLRSNSAAAEVPACDAVEARHSPPGLPRYSVDFAAILGDGGDSAGAQRIKSLRFRPSGDASRGGIARSRLRWALAGAASVIAVTAVAGTAYWPDGSSHYRQAVASTAEPVQAEPAIEPAPEPQMALPLLPAVTDWAGPEPLLQQQLADLARWPATAEATKAPLLAMLKPDTIQTARDGLDAAGLASGTESALAPARTTAEAVREIATATGDTTDGADVEEEEATPARTASISSGLDPHDSDRAGISDDSVRSVAGLQPDQAAPGGSNDGSAGGGGESGDKSGAGERGGSGGDSGRGASGGGGKSGGGESGAGGDSEGGESGGGESGGSEGAGGESSGGGSEGSESGGGESGGDGDSEGGDSEGGESDGESGEGSSGGGLGGAVGGLLGGARDVIGGIGKALGGKDNGADGGKDKGGGKRGGNG